MINTKHNTMLFIITTHAKKRLKERMKSNIKAETLAKRAYYRGVKYENIEDGGLFRLLAKLLVSENRTLRIYGNMIFIFNSEPKRVCLITVLYLPKAYRSIKSLR